MLKLTPKSMRFKVIRIKWSLNLGAYLVTLRATDRERLKLAKIVNLNVEIRLEKRFLNFCLALAARTCHEGWICVNRCGKRLMRSKS